MMTVDPWRGGVVLNRDILVYADVDLNLIDGSAVWLASLTEMLSLEPDLSVHVLLKRPLKQNRLVKQLLNKSNVRFIDPWSDVDDPAATRALSRLNRDALDTEAAATLIQILDRDIDAGRILVRGDGILYRICGDAVISEKLISYITNPPAYADFEGMQRMIRIHQKSRLTLLQTPMAVDSFTDLLGVRATRNRIDILNPMVPDANFEQPMQRQRTPLSLGYSGKFSPPYMIEEMLTAFSSIQKSNSRATFHVVGDKIHNRPFVEGFEERIRTGLEVGGGVIWHGGVSRERANQLMGDVMVASGWRDPSFDDTVEISTKVLEYAALGVPVLMRPAAVQVAVFGEDMPTWVESEAEFKSSFERLSTDEKFHIEVATSMREAVRSYSMSATNERLRKHLI
jgi:glycosyltransferase involved in cell wall biosynthesis